MARLVVVSSNAALGFALNSAGHEVQLAEDGNDVRWAEYTAFAEVVLLDVSDPPSAAVLIEGIADSALDPVWVLLIASRNPAWDDVLHARAQGISIMPLPLSIPAITATLKTLMAGPPLPRHGALEAAIPEPETKPETEPEPDPAQNPTWLLPDAPPGANTESEPSYATPLDPVQADSEPEMAPKTGAKTEVDADANPTWLTTDAPTTDTKGADQDKPGEPRVPEWDPTWVKPEHRGIVVTRLDPPTSRANSLVRSLAACTDDLYTLADTAEFVVAEAVKLVSADGAAVLLRDGLAWRVAAGLGLRALEERLTLTAEHWLVEQVSSSLHGILLTSGEGAFRELYGAPLSGSQNLLAAPLPPHGGILLLARHDQPFTEQDLQTLIVFLVEAGVTLSDALDARRLARQLVVHLDLDG